MSGHKQGELSLPLMVGRRAAMSTNFGIIYQLLRQRAVNHYLTLEMSTGWHGLNLYSSFQGVAGVLQEVRVNDTPPQASPKHVSIFGLFPKGGSHVRG